MKLKPMEPIRSQVATYFAQHPSATSSGSDLKALLDKGVAVEWLDTFTHPMGQTFAAVKYGDEVIFVREADAKAQFGALQTAREHTVGGIFGTETASSQTQSRVITALTDRSISPYVYENDLVRVAGSELRRTGRLDDGFFEGVATAKKLDVRHFMVEKLDVVLTQLRSDFGTRPAGWDDQAQRVFAVLADNSKQPYVSGTDVRTLAARELATTGTLGPGFFIGADHANKFDLRGWIDNSEETLATLKASFTGSPPANWDEQAQRVFARMTDDKHQDPYVTESNVRTYAAEELVKTGCLGPGFFAAAGLAETVRERMFIHGADKEVASLKEKYATPPPGWNEQASRVFTKLIDKHQGPYVSGSELRSIAAVEVAQHGGVNEGFFAAVKLAEGLRERMFLAASDDLAQLKKDFPV